MSSRVVRWISLDSDVVVDHIDWLQETARDTGTAFATNVQEKIELSEYGYDSLAHTTTLLIIDREGSIVTYIRKMIDLSSPETDHQRPPEEPAPWLDELIAHSVNTVTLNNHAGRPYTFFPIICGDLWSGDELTTWHINQMHKNGALRADFIIQPIRMGDWSNFSIFNDIQDSALDPSDPSYGWAWDMIVEEILIERYLVVEELLWPEGSYYFPNDTAGLPPTPNMGVWELKSYPPGPDPFEDYELTPDYLLARIPLLAR